MNAFDRKTESAIKHAIASLCVTVAIDKLCAALDMPKPKRVEGTPEIFWQLHTLNKINAELPGTLNRTKYQSMANGAASAFNELKRSGLAQQGSRPVVRSLCEKMLQQVEGEQ